MSWRAGRPFSSGMNHLSLMNFFDNFIHLSPADHIISIEFTRFKSIGFFKFYILFAGTYAEITNKKNQWEPQEQASILFSIFTSILFSIFYKYFIYNFFI